MPADFEMNVVEKAPISVMEEATTDNSDALFAAAMAAIPKDEEPTSEEAIAAASTVAASAAEVAPPAPEVKTPERIAPTLLKIMERESALVERESKLKAAEADILALRQHIDGYEDAQKKFKYSPVEYIRKLAPDINLADLAKQLWYEQLGEAAPAEYRATREARAAKSTVEELRAEMEQRLQAERQRWSEESQRAEQEKAYNQYIGALGNVAKAPPDEYPLVKSFAQTSPERVHQALFKIAQKHAQATGGEVLSPQECAAKLNSELSNLRTALGVQDSPSVPATKQAAPPVSTLRNKHSSVQPNRAMPDTLDPESKFNLALEAARAAVPIDS